MKIKKKMPANFNGRSRGRDSDSIYSDAMALKAGVDIDYTDMYRYLTPKEKAYALKLQKGGALTASGKGGGYITPASMQHLMKPKARIIGSSLIRQQKRGENPGGRGAGLLGSLPDGQKKVTRPATIQLAPPKGIPEEDTSKSKRNVRYKSIGPGGTTNAIIGRSMQDVARILDKTGKPEAAERLRRNNPSD